MKTQWAGLALGALLVSPRAAAAPPSKQQCAQAYAETQAQRKAGKLRAAREQALLCVQPSCPGIITRDCRPWLEELERSLPTVVLVAHGPSGKDVAAVRVTMDGQPFALQLGGDARAVDPGEHSFRFETEGSAPVDVTVILREGERNRSIEASFAPPPAPAPAPPSPSPSMSMSMSPAVFALGGIAVAGLGVFATFGTLGEAQKSGLDKTCAPHCLPAQADSVRTKLIIGDVGLFTALAAMGAGVTVVLVGRASRPQPVHAALGVEVIAAPWGGMLVARARF